MIFPRNQQLPTFGCWLVKPSLEAVIGLLEERIGERRSCPHCLRRAGL